MFDADNLSIAEALGADNVSKFAGKTILILGGSGFLGSAYKNFFLSLNKSHLASPCLVISVDNYVKGTVVMNDETKDANLLSFVHDASIPLTYQLHNYKIDFIINCCGNAAPPGYEARPIETALISTLGTVHALDLAISKKAKVLHFSSSEVLGTPPDDEIPTSEESIGRIHSLNKRGIYDTSKLQMESICYSYRTKYHLDCKIVRPFNVVGYFHYNDYRVFPNFVSKALKNQNLEIYAPGTQTRTFCFYTDFLVGSLLVLLNASDLLYNIGNSENEISMIDFARLVERIAGKPGLAQLVPPPDVYTHEPKRRCPSIEKAKRELGYQPKVSLETMVEKVYRWAEQTYPR